MKRTKTNAKKVDLDSMKKNEGIRRVLTLKVWQAMNALVESNEALMKLNSEKDARIKLLTDQLTSALNIPALNIPATYEEKQAINQTGRTSVRDGHGAGKNIFILSFYEFYEFYEAAPTRDSSFDKYEPAILY